MSKVDYKKKYEELRADYDEFMRDVMSHPKTVLVSIENGVARVVAHPQDINVQIKQGEFTESFIKSVKKQKSNGWELIWEVFTHFRNKKSNLKQFEAVMLKMAYKLVPQNLWKAQKDHWKSL